MGPNFPYLKNTVNQRNEIEPSTRIKKRRKKKCVNYISENSRWKTREQGKILEETKIFNGHSGDKNEISRRTRLTELERPSSPLIGIIGGQPQGRVEWKILMTSLVEGNLATWKV